MVTDFIYYNRVLAKSKFGHFLSLTLNRLLWSENSHHRGKYQCMPDLLFDWFGFDQTSKTFAN